MRYVFGDDGQWICRSSEAGSEDHLMTFPDDSTARRFLRRYLGHALAMGSMRRALLNTADQNLRRNSDHDVVEAIVPLLVSSQLVVITSAQHTGGGGAISATPQTPVVFEPAAPAPPPREGVHWIEIDLVDDADEPFGLQKYVVVLPDGEKIQGRLDDDGHARIANIVNPGECEIHFPSFDMDAWEPA